MSSLPRFTDHTYHDYSTFIKDGGVIKKHKKSERNFPARLHAMLSNEKYSHIITWMPHGRAWKVLDKELLVKEVIPVYFGQSKFASFTRQLSGWGFKRLHQTGEDHGCYYHECFLRGHPRLTVLMRRVNGGKGKSTPNQQSEPDFYEILKTHPLQEAVDDKPVFSPIFDTRAENNSDPFPVAGGHNSDSFATKSDSAPVSLFETSIDEHVASGSKHHVGKTEQNTAFMFRHNYLGGGNLYDQSTNNVKINNIQNQSQIRAQPPQSAVAPACVGVEDGICRHGAAECSQQYAAAAARVPRQEVGFAAYGYSHRSNPQSYFHDPLMTYQNPYQQESNYGQVQGGNFRYTPAVVPNSLPRNNMRSSNDVWIANTATDDSLLSQPMSIPENGFDFNVTSLEDSFRTSAIDPPQEKKRND